MEILTRKEALERGLKTYFSGKDCKHGHSPCERYTKDNRCTVCESIRGKGYYTDNKERIIKRHKKYYIDSKEIIVKCAKEYYINNKENIRVSKKKYYIDNKERINKYHREYAVLNRDKMCSNDANRRASKLQRTPIWGNTWLQKILKEEIFLISKIKSLVTNIPQHVDHYYPLQGKLVSGLHVIGNLQIITSEENEQKHNRMPEEFYVS